MVRSFDSFDFEVEHKPRAKIGLADYLSPNLKGAALPVSAYDRMFTVAKIRSIRSALGFDQNNSAAGPVFLAHQRQLFKLHELCKFSSHNSPVEGVVSCENELTNEKRARGILR